MKHSYKRTKNNNCEYCGKPINGLPFKCKFCSKSFCYEDRLPEDHNCTGLAEYKERVQKGEEGVFSGFKNIGPHSRFTMPSYSFKPKPDLTRHKNERIKSEDILKDIFVYKRGIIRAIILGVILTLLIAFNLGIKTNYSVSSLVFGTFGFVLDFFIILIISAIINIRNKWGNLIAAITISLFLGTGSIPIINSVLGSIAMLLSLVSISYLSFVAGNVIKHGNYNRIELYTSYIFRAAFVVVLILIVISLVTNHATLSRINSDLSSLGNYINSGSNVPTEQINSTWVNQFFTGVNSYRSSSKLSYCPTLSTFAAAIYTTMNQNIQISHYGYSKTFDSFWPNGYTYGGYIYSAFGEEVLYPNEPGSSTTTCVDFIFCSTSNNEVRNYTPSAYISDLISSAPLHWQGLISNDISYYGYYVKNGPGYSILGPDNGQLSCSTTEIPGPNINITQYFAQYGCTTELTTATWFVIELAPVCPS